MHEITYYLQYIPKFMILFVLFAMSYLFMLDNGKKTKDRLIELLFKQKWVISFLLYSVLLLMGTIFDRKRTNPFQYMFVFLGFISEGEINWDSIKNIVVFIPLTFFYLKAFPHKNTFRTAFILSVIVTFFIEVTQLLFWIGSFQIEDIIYNIFGGLIGWLFICFLQLRKNNKKQYKI